MKKLSIQVEAYEHEDKKYLRLKALNAVWFQLVEMDDADTPDVLVGCSPLRGRKLEEIREIEHLGQSLENMEKVGELASDEDIEEAIKVAKELQDMLNALYGKDRG